MKGIRKTRCAFSLCSTLVALSGCASSQGLSPDALYGTIRQEESRFFDNAAPTDVQAQPQAPRLGLYLKPTGFLHREFEWTGRDRDTIHAWSLQIPLGAGGKSTGFLTLSSLKGDTLRELRATAARYGVDWLLIFDGAAAVDRYNNYKAGLLYWTIIGAYMADGTHSDALCVLKASLWDVRTGARYFEEQAEAKSEEVGPAALLDDTAVLDTAKRKALEDLMRRLEAQFRRFKLGR
ncbi:MAG TPA: hypothetical protein VJR69_13100 [Nitrospira sp.]|nr:hypothetical protein [Nitrospira sp.]